MVGAGCTPLADLSATRPAPRVMQQLRAALSRQQEIACHQSSVALARKAPRPCRLSMFKDILFGAPETGLSGHEGLQQRRRHAAAARLQQLPKGPWWPFPASRGLIACALESGTFCGMFLNYFRLEKPSSGAWYEPGTQERLPFGQLKRRQIANKF